MTHLQKFRKTFKIDKHADLRNVSVAVEAVYQAQAIAFDYLTETTPKDNAEGFRIHSFINLLSRIYEHSLAMLVAIATGSPASAEALGRIVVEGSINLMFMAERGNAATLINFFSSWLNEHNRKLSDWKQAIQTEPYADVVVKMIESRRSVIDILRQYLDGAQHHCEIDLSLSNGEWPKSILQRFTALGRETDYYTSYHRLSGASHITGEDTLSWLISLEMDDTQKQQMGREAWANSIMMSRIATLFYLDAVISCVRSVHRPDNKDLELCKVSLESAVREIAKDAGVPL